LSDEVRIAHLSDLHLPLATPRGLEWLGKRGLSGLSWHIRRSRLHRLDIAEALLADMLATPHDVVAMTGDLINFGLEREFAAARPWLERMGPPDRVIALPGNHEALAGRWDGAMRRHWLAYSEAGRYLVTGFVALISVSTAVVTPPFMASGRVGRLGQERLADQLSQARGDNLLPVVLMHHPPTAITIKRKSLSDLTATARVLAEGGAGLVLHGHTHRRELSWIDAPHGRIPVLGIPSFSMNPTGRRYPGAWRMVRITGGPGAARVEMIEHAITPDLDIQVRTPLRLALATAGAGVSAN